MTASPALHPAIFKAYDIRGVVDETLTDAAVEQIGQSLGRMMFMQGQARCVVGRDGRLSGERLAQAQIELVS